MPSPCNKRCRGKDCTFFELVSVTYNQPQCLLADSEQEITIVIHGKDTGDDSFQTHEFLLEVYETGYIKYAEFARKSDSVPRKLISGGIDESGRINTNESKTIIFLVKRRNSVSSQQKIRVYCTWRHADPNHHECGYLHDETIFLTVM